MATDMGFEPVESGEYYFISYSKEDYERVGRIAKILNKKGIPLWYDKGIHEGTDWSKVLNEHLKYCKAIVMFVSRAPFMKKDPYIRVEYDIASAFKKTLQTVYIDELRDDDIPTDYMDWWVKLRRTQGLERAHEWEDEKIANEIIRVLGESTEYVEDHSILLDLSPLPERGFKYFIGGQPYSDDPAILARPINGLRVKRLKDALKDIFSHWNTDEVFRDADGEMLKGDNREGKVDHSAKPFQDNFVKLIRVACRNENLDAIQATRILKSKVGTNATRNKNSRFLRLFYEVIFKGKDRPVGFYWSNSLSQASLTPLFNDSIDFAERLCDSSVRGDRVRELFNTHTHEICSFLGISNPLMLLDNIMMTYANQHGEILLLNSEGKAPVKLGSIKEFAAKMTALPKLEEAEAMVDFLRRFLLVPVSAGSDEYELKIRDADSFLVEVSEDRLGGASEIFEMLSITDRGKAVLARYLTLLSEYFKMTSAQKIDIPTKYGMMTFNFADAEGDVKRIAKEYCEIAFGDGVPDALKNSELARKGGFIKLMQIFEDNKVVAIEGGAENTAKYYALTEGTTASAAKYVSLFGNENLSVFYKNQPVPIEEYVTKKLATLSGEEICRFMDGTPVVSAYIERNKKLVKDSDREFDALFADRKKRFDEFESYVESIVRGENKTEEYVKVEDTPEEALPEIPDTPFELIEEDKTLYKVKERGEIKTEEDNPPVKPAEKSEVNAEEVKPREEDKSLDKPEDKGNARADEAPQNTATPVPPVPPADPTPPAAAPVRRARQPRNKSADTAVNEQKLSELLGL